MTSELELCFYAAVIMNYVATLHNHSEFEQSQSVRL